MTVGYISDFDSLELVDDTATLGGVVKKAQSLVGDTNEVIDRFRDLANGTRVNYDGTADSDVRPGEAKQRISCNSGAPAYVASVEAKKKYRGTVTKRKWAGGAATYETCTGVLQEVKILSQSSPVLDHMTIELHFKFESVWS